MIRDNLIDIFYYRCLRKTCRGILPAKRGNRIIKRLNKLQNFILERYLSLPDKKMLIESTISHSFLQVNLIKRRTSNMRGVSIFFAEEESIKTLNLSSGINIE